ncbi:hypothetical protein FXO37_09687 [Capsicum annuum]|nr:hypothetical protein FXO37_09687 [Capsicum annuum]
MQKGRNDKEIINDRHRGRSVSYWCYCKTLGGLNHCNTVYHVLVSGIDGLSITSIIAELTAAAISYDLTNDGISSLLEANLASCGKLLIILLIQHCLLGHHRITSPEQLQTLEELYRRGMRTPSAEQIQHITAQASNITLRSFLVASGNSPAWLSPSGDFALGFHQIDAENEDQKSEDGDEKEEDEDGEGR